MSTNNYTTLNMSEINAYRMDGLGNDFIIVDRRENSINLSKEKIIKPSIKVSYDIKKDIISLINFSQYCHNSNIHSNWRKTLPIYPTSPIDNKNG